MIDVALSNKGAHIVLATSNDENHPPENIINGNTDTFWSSTGLFPQEFIVNFQNMVNINSIRLHCYNVRRLAVDRSVQDEPRDFEPVTEKELEPTDGQLQMEEMILSNVTAQHLRFTMSAAYDHFVTVHKLYVDGIVVQG